jgi:tetratricopeptide (TPR) repeat protein
MGGRRWNVYNILGIAVIILAVFGGLALVLWSESPKTGGDVSYLAAVQEMDKGNYPAAIKSFEKSLKTNPMNGAARLGIARAYVRLK